MPSPSGFLLRECIPSEGGRATLASPCQAHPITAVAREPSLLTLHNQDGEQVGDKLTLAAPAAKLAWQPGTLTLAAGLENGSVELVTLPAGSRVTGDQERSSHKASITLLKWSPDGSRLLSGDANGTVVLWKLDQNNSGIKGMIPAHVFRKGGVITEAAFVTFPGSINPLATSTTTTASGASSGRSKQDDSSNNNNQLLAVVPPTSPGTTAFVFGGDAGVLTFGNESGSSVDLLTDLHSAIDAIEFTTATPTMGAGSASSSSSSSGSGRVAVMTRSQLISVLHYSAKDGRVTTLARQKMSSSTAASSSSSSSPTNAEGSAAPTSANAGVKGRAMIGASTAAARFLATVTPDSSEASTVRYWDIANAGIGGTSSADALRSYKLSSCVGAANASRSAAAAAAAASSDDPGFFPPPALSEQGSIATVTKIPPQEKLVSVAFSATGSLLAAGSQSGGLYLWRRHAAEGTTLSGWEPVFSTSFPSAVVALDFSGANAGASSSLSAPSPVLIVRLASDQVFSLREFHLPKKAVGNLAVMMNSPTSIAIERRGPPNPADRGCPGGALTRAAVAVTTLARPIGGALLLGMDCTEHHLVVWNGKGCEIYAVPEFAASAASSATGEAVPSSGGGATPSATRMRVLPAPKLVGAFSSYAHLFGIVGDAVFASIHGPSSSFALCNAISAATPQAAAAASADFNQGAAILAHNFAGAVRHTIALGERDGFVTAIDTASSQPTAAASPSSPTAGGAGTMIAGKYLAFATSAGRLSVFDVSRVEPKQVASGRFEEPSSGSLLGLVSSLRVNGDGSRLAIIAKRVLVTSPLMEEPPRYLATKTIDMGGAGAASSSVSASSSVFGWGSDRALDSRVYVYSADADKLSTYDCTNGATAVVGAVTGSTTANSSAPASSPKSSSSGSSSSPAKLSLSSVAQQQQQQRRIPVFVCWDPNENRQLAIETAKVKSNASLDTVPTPPGARAAASSSGGSARASDSKEGKESEDGASKDDGEDDEIDAGSGLATGKGKKGKGAGLSENEPDAEVVTILCTNAEKSSSSAAGGSSASAGLISGVGSGEALIQQDSIPLQHPNSASGLLSLCTPYLHLVLSPEMVPLGGSRVSLRTLRDFVDLEDADDATRRALLDFSLHMASGNMDDAYRAIRAFTMAATAATTVAGADPQVAAANAAAVSAHLWENMASLSVKSKRLDVAQICLGQMGHARGAKAVRELAKEPELEANIAQVAIQLGMLADAARLYQSCGRYDLLNKLYQDSGQWERAIAVAARHDRVRLKATHFAYARYLESVGDYIAAIRQYELSGSGKTEVTRMLHDAKDPKALEAYVDTCEDKEILRWFGQYLETQSRFQEAVQYYRRANDVFSLVRLGCASGDFRGAADLVLQTGDKAASFHLARALEAAGNTKDALVFYEKSGRYNHAVRLAKASGTDAELLTLALEADRSVQLDVGRHFEDRGYADRAVQLYRRAGALGRAVDICFANGLFDDLKDIADNELSTAAAQAAARAHKGSGGANGADGGADGLDGDEEEDEDGVGISAEGPSPELLRKCADFFVSNGQFDKAASLLITARRFMEAVEMCASHKIEVTEAMAESMTPPKPAGGAAAAAVVSPAEEAAYNAAKEARNAVLIKLARLLRKQGSFQLACKKFTQAGDKLKAMECLIQAGDTEKILFFANKSKSADVYILAANHLQTLAWHSDPDLLGAIVDFYTKAKAWEQLSAFYEACAAVEIDEYRNYEKALAAMKEALKSASKIKAEIKEARTASLQGRIAIIERFVSARKLAKTDMAAMAEACRSLLELRDAEAAIRVGDVYALLVYFHAQTAQQAAGAATTTSATRSAAASNWRTARELIEDMRARGILLEPFIEATVIREIYVSCGIDPVKAGVLPPDANNAHGIDDGLVQEQKQAAAAAQQAKASSGSGGGSGRRR